MDIEFSPTEPERGDANWIQTIPGQHCFSYFRLYGPLETYFDRSWKLGDITAATEDLPLRTEAGVPHCRSCCCASGCLGNRATGR